MLSGVFEGDALHRMESSMDANPQDQLHQHPTDHSSQRTDDSNIISETDFVSEGKWGERGARDVKQGIAMQEYEVLRQDLIDLHKTRTAESQAIKPLTTRSRGSHAVRSQTRQTRVDDAETDVEAAGDDDKRVSTLHAFMELPAAIISGFLYWVLWYWPTGLSTESSVPGYTFLMTILFFVFVDSWGQWVCAFAPSFTVISNVLPFFFVMFGLFNSVVRSYSTLPVFWRYWMYWVNPSTYWIGGVLGPH
ncbi:ABC-2 type transporter-domain-containing protein [Dactylonectria macrodidyma]|uniref:ABC-2 type transporter-domain-containing protein n=1 Tax=Dactylonectria macrodidyma TaxID=307937 RepID=A0A9P9EB42_9HYPO|nr:ABC-2 type transporter-domain-containing protein [Dactylonectria macrodidyma]